MQRRWAGIGLLFLILVIGVVLTWVVAAKGFYRPDSQLYGWQLASERLYQRVIGDEALARYELELIDRRFADLVQASGTTDEPAAFDAFAFALQNGVQGVETASPESQTALRASLLDLSTRAPASIQYLPSVIDDQAALADLEARLEYIHAWAVDPDLSGQILSASVADKWLPEALHTAFPLVGAHLAAACEDCHVEGDYTALPAACTDCHGDTRPAPHFPGTCGICHSDEGWDSAAFIHEGVPDLDCESCHADKAPENHHQAQCSACHEFADWEEVVFNHEAVGATDCQRCHQEERPAEHFPGQCSLCHVFDEWADAGFAHLSVDTCGSCHVKNRPASHFPGDCSTCHMPGVWAGAAFNHQAVESCAECHESWRPPDHFDGDCSLCHLPGSFVNATFNHHGAEDCLACHIEDRTVGHFERQCSQCHNTDGWSNPVYSHTFPRNHGGANPSNCGTCHAAGLGSYTCFACHDAGRIDHEHRDEGVNYHNNCAACHPRGHD